VRFWREEEGALRQGEAAARGGQVRAIARSRYQLIGKPADPTLSSKARAG
jgi:hypothetical protein